MDYFDPRHYINDRPVEISPKGTWLSTERVSAGDLPEALFEPFGEIIKDPHAPWHEIEFHKVLGGAQDIWMLGCHEVSPFNPRGYDFFFRGDGTYLGYMES